MSDPVDSGDLSRRLIQLGLGPEEAEVYLLVLRHGPATPLSLSRTSGLARSTLYRHLEKLEAKRLAVSDAGSFRAGSPAALERLVAERQRELDGQKAMLPDVMGALAGISAGGTFGSRIVHYSGADGLRQVTENTLEARGRLAIFELRDMSALVDVDFAESVRRRMAERHFEVRQLTNARRLENWTTVAEFVTGHWQCRHVSTKELPITYETLVYDDVLAAYTFRDDEIFCVEIRNAALARMQLQLFDFVWNRATPMRVLQPGGASEVVR